MQHDPDDIRFFARCIVEYLERKEYLTSSLNGVAFTLAINVMLHTKRTRQ